MSSLWMRRYTSAHSLSWTRMCAGRCDAEVRRRARERASERTSFIGSVWDIQRGLPLLACFLCPRATRRWTSACAAAVTKPRVSLAMQAHVEGLWNALTMHARLS